MSIVVNSQQVKALSEVGWLAASRGLGAQAEAIFEALVACRPSEDAGFIGLAYVFLGMNRIQDAVDILARAPRTEAVDLFSGIAAWRASDVVSAIRIFQHIQRFGSNADHVRMATAFLDEMGG